MKRYAFWLVILFGVASSFYSCKEEIQPEPAIGEEYFTNEIGTWLEYTVDTIFQDVNSNVHDTNHFYRRDLLESNFTDAVGRPSVRIERYKRMQPTDSWGIADIWYQTVTENAAERIEENVRYIKMKFPMKDGDIWNGNLYNIEDAWNYTVTKMHQPFDINGLHFDSTVTIEQIDSTNLVQRLYGKEVWAKNVGLVYKKYINYKLENVKLQLPTKLDSVWGAEYEYKATGFGKQ